jgi:hypothetical protein
MFELVGSTNVGDYSPTEVIATDNVKMALGIMGRPEFDPEKQVVLREALPDSLVPATNGYVCFGHGCIYVSAHSEGTSVLVLPILYSSGWEFQPYPDNDGSVRLLRANLVQTGVQFSGRLNGRLVYRFGLITDSRARLRDLQEMKQMKIEEAE